MASHKQSCGVEPPAPPDIAALQLKVMDHGEKEGLVATAPGPAASLATAAHRLRCKAFLVLAICLSATALPYSLGSLAALPKALPESPLPSSTWTCSPASQQGPGDDVVATRGDLLKEAEVQQRVTVLMGSRGTSGSFPGAAEDVTHGTDAEGWSLGTPTTASPLTAWTLPQWQPGPRHGEGLSMGTAVSVTQWLGTSESATSAQLLQIVDNPSPASQHLLALGSLPGTGLSLHGAVQVPAVTLSPGLGQSVGMTEHPSPGAHVPPDAPAHPGMLPKGHNTAEQPRNDQILALGSSPDQQTMPCRAELSLAVSSKPPALVTASDLTSWASTAPASAQPTASSFSDVQHGAPVAGATTRSHNGQKKEVSSSPGLPDLGMSEEQTTAPQLVPLPAVPSALPTKGTANSTKRHPGTAWVPSPVTPEMAWDMWPAATPLHGEAALLVNTVWTKVRGNGSGLLATVLASLPSTTLAHTVNHPQVLVPSLPPTEAQGPAVTLGTLTGLSSRSAQQTLPTTTGAHPSSAWTRASSPAGPTVTGVSSAASDTIPEPGATKVPCKDGAAMVPPSSLGAAGVTRGFPLRSPPQRPPLHPDIFLSTASEHGPTAGSHQPTKVAEMSVLPGQVAVAEAGHTELRTASAGPPEPTHASLGSVPSASSKNPTLEPCSEAVDPTSTTSLSSPPYLLLSTGALHAVSSPASSPTLAGPPAAESMSNPSVASQPSSTTREHLPPAAGEAFTPAELLTMGNPSSSEVQPPAPQVLPLQFRLLGITYSQALGSRASESYRQLEEEVKLMLNQMLSTYETFLQADVLEFRNGSVVVRGEALFRGDAPAPTNSHLIRTLLTEASRGRSIFNWQLEPQSVQSGGFSLENLDPEKLSISLTVIQLGRDRTESLERLIREVTLSLSTLYKVSNFTLIQLRNLSGQLEITGAIYLNTSLHADVAEVLQALTALATCSVDLTSLSVEGARLELQVYPVSFLITNRHFSEDLLDPLAVEHQELTRNLSDVVARTLRRAHRSFLQVVIRGFLPGSLICHGDVVFQHPAPTSLQVLEALVLAVGPNKALAGSDFQVDPYSLAVGEATLEPPQPQPGFPEYGVAIMVVCGLCIITAPIVLLLCLRTKRFRWWDREVLWDRRDAEAGTQTLEMDSQRFWALSEESHMDAHTHWQNDSV